MASGPDADDALGLRLLPVGEAGGDRGDQLRHPAVRRRGGAARGDARADGGRASHRADCGARGRRRLAPPVHARRPLPTPARGQEGRVEDAVGRAQLLARLAVVSGGCVRERAPADAWPDGLEPHDPAQRAREGGAVLRPCDGHPGGRRDDWSVGASARGWQRGRADAGIQDRDLGRGGRSRQLAHARDVERGLAPRRAGVAATDGPREDGARSRPLAGDGLPAELRGRVPVQEPDRAAARGHGADRRRGARLQEQQGRAHAQRPGAVRGGARAQGPRVVSDRDADAEAAARAVVGPHAGRHRVRGVRIVEQLRAPDGRRRGLLGRHDLGGRGRPERPGFSCAR